MKAHESKGDILEFVQYLQKKPSESDKCLGLEDYEQQDAEDLARLIVGKE